MFNNKGITIIELIIAIALVSVMAAISSASFHQWRSHVSLINQVDELKSKVIEVRQLAIAAASEKNWGIHLEEDQYIIFSGDSYNELASNNEIVSLRNISILNPTTSLSNGIGGFSPDLIFTKFTGQTANTGTVELIYNNNINITRFIRIDELGKIN